eukprot:CAMPEP_0176358644 /NCGR_PEP_ID=MMETSP0126-20121128/15728_1 /TAXON_ID=141414 ORGANISM="Strombidinopsis acuminatum, Strain SPMC142" /NCGR_SAMPLE_ID=MMETSP0126 /ASSEMBLY_ACC=CAM_ASM_000229 /LENGTH=110 /DNA_ID=CAMNT_0017712955 /DNA_START=665 /DNA_END=997 /DNA_ORIENTATION=+
MRIILRLQLIYNIPLVLLKGLLLKPKKNVLHDGKRELTGNKEVVHTNEMDFEEIKNAAKKLNITINDLFTSALSVGLKNYMNKRGDDSSQLQIVIPASIRWQFYPTYESV